MDFHSLLDCAFNTSLGRSSRPPRTALDRGTWQTWVAYDSQVRTRTRELFTKAHSFKFRCRRETFIIGTVHSAQYGLFFRPRELARTHAVAVQRSTAQHSAVRQRPSLLRCRTTTQEELDEELMLQAPLPALQCFAYEKGTQCRTLVDELVRVGALRKDGRRYVPAPALLSPTLTASASVHPTARHDDGGGDDDTVDEDGGDAGRDGTAADATVVAAAAAAQVKSPGDVAAELLAGSNFAVFIPVLARLGEWWNDVNRKIRKFNLRRPPVQSWLQWLR